MKKKFAFTLAEVLITLSIIGVVAAITMPILMQKYQKMVLVNQLKKAYTTFSQAIHKMMADDVVDNFSDTEFSKYRITSFNPATEEKAINILKSYLNAYKIEYNVAPSISYRDLANNEFRNNLSQAFSIYFSDGAIAYFDGYGIYIDVNGEKGPNILDRDLFYFKLEPNGSIKPNESDLGYGYEYETSIGIGTGAGRIIKDGWKMNY